MKLVVATKNEGKMSEIRQILKGIEIDILSQKNLNIETQAQENGETFEENAYMKAKYICDICNEIVIADDSGLEVDALDGRPGVRTARYAGENATDKENYEKLLLEMQDIKDRKARFVCVISCVFPDGGHFESRGECQGEIFLSPQGETGFGYDPVFYVKEYKKTFAQLPKEIKNSISHRGNALKLFKEEFEKRI